MAKTTTAETCVKQTMTSEDRERRRRMGLEATIWSKKRSKESKKPVTPGQLALRRATLARAFLKMEHALTA